MTTTGRISTKWNNESWQPFNEINHEVAINANILQISNERNKTISNDVSNINAHELETEKCTSHTKKSLYKKTNVSPGGRSRLLRDFYRLACDPPVGVSGAPVDTDIWRWQGIILGPIGSPWEGGIFKLSISFDENYPFIAPCVRFLTKMFHPNVGPSGEISLGILGDNWNPVYDVVTILLSVQSLLHEPNLTCKAGLEASILFSENKLEYNRRIRDVVRKTWDNE